MSMSTETTVLPSVPIAVAEVPTATAPVTRIRPSSGWRTVNLREIWQYRELLYFLTWRDVKVRYKQTLLGAAWAIIQPLFTMVIFTLLFRKLAHMPSGSDPAGNNPPYELFSFVALLPWTYFANAMSTASNSLVSSANLITKIYFPRLIVPGAAVIAGLVDYCITLAVLLVMVAGYVLAASLGYDVDGVIHWPPWTIIVTLPLLTLITSAIALGTSLWLSAVNVQYRDIRYVVPFLIQVWMYASPIVYPLSQVPERYRWIVALNPLAGVIEGYRSAFFGGPLDVASLTLSLSAGVALLASGALYFRRVERTFADVI
jgi:lipopolysaccharide transport system permease protein